MHRNVPASDNNDKTISQETSAEYSKPVLKKTLAFTSGKIVIQILYKIQTFLLNAYLLRYISSHILGIANVRLNLIYSTLLITSRESFRRACSSPASPKCWTSFINLLWLIIPIGFVIALVLYPIWLYLLPQPSDPQYAFAIVLYLIAGLIELIGEPLAIIGHQALLVNHRVLTEGMANIFRFVTLFISISLYPTYGLLCFAISNIVFALVTSCSYFMYFSWIIFTDNTKTYFDQLPIKSFSDILPTSNPLNYSIDKASGRLVCSFAFQSFLKEFLTNGERYLMTCFNLLDFSDQGIYDVVSNLGSLAPRLIFLSIEDGAYLFFTQTVKRGVPAEKQDKIDLVIKSLRGGLSGVSILGLTIAVYGQGYSHLLLEIYGGSALAQSSGPAILRCFSLYVLLLAWNGLTECFMNASMTESQVHRHNVNMIAFSAVFTAASVIFVRVLDLGGVGFVLANSVNMLMRVVFSVSYIHRYLRSYEQRGMSPCWSLLPKFLVSSSYLVSLILVLLSQRYFGFSSSVNDKFVHVLIGGFCLLVNLVCILVSQKEIIHFIRSLVRKYKSE